MISGTCHQKDAHNLDPTLKRKIVITTGVFS